MNWKIKAHIMAVLSRAPTGERVYHTLQRVLGTNRLNVQEGLARCVDIVNLAREAGCDLQHARVVEIGTGWRPFLPFVLSLLGAKRIITLDIHPWLTSRYAWETYHACRSQLESLADQLQIDRAVLKERFETVRPRDDSLNALLEAFRIEYRCPGDAACTGLEASSVDVVCSSNVLEHVGAEIIAAIHSESYRILRPGGCAIHRFNPGDHYASVDKRITTANFVRYSGADWHWYGGSGLSYHNRLRCVDHARLLEQAGFALVIDRVRVSQKALGALSRGEIPVHPEFAGYTSEQLAADYMWLVGRPAPAPAEALSSRADANVSAACS